MNWLAWVSEGEFLGRSHNSYMILQKDETSLCFHSSYTVKTMRQSTYFLCCILHKGFKGNGALSCLQEPTNSLSQQI